jgi:ferredoxin-NADP reductase
MTVPPPGAWQAATVTAIAPETANAKTYRLRVERPTPYVPGQHFIVRLTAEDGYAAQRSYSAASAPDDPSEVELTVERLDDGEVSTFLHDELRVGDVIEVRGPIGGWFVWSGEGPALLIGGGSGVVPLMSMLRWARQSGRSDLLQVVVSVRAPDDLYYAAELPGPEVSVIYTRVAPPGEPRPAGRLAREDLAGRFGFDTTAYVCGSAGFAGVATAHLVDLGLPAAQIRVERFGPTG